MGLNLGSAEISYEHLVNVEAVENPELMRVEPGNPDDSYLVIKLEGTERMIASLMPLGRDALSDDKIQLVRQWIAEGANPP